MCIFIIYVMNLYTNSTRVFVFTALRQVTDVKHFVRMDAYLLAKI